MRPLVLHLDVDAFFAAIEQLKNPTLRGKPVIVGAGVIASCSYEARKFGLRAAMPIREALRLCPRAIVLEGDQTTYACFARAIWDVMARWMPEVETYLDEAYGDLTGTELLYGNDPLAVGRELKRQIREEIGLSVTVGIASNRMIAKMAGKLTKPDGLAFVPWGEEAAFVADRPVDDLIGVGPVTDRLFAGMNIRTVRDLRALSPDLLHAMLGKNGTTLHERARGRDPRTFQAERLPHTISRDTSVHSPCSDGATIRAYLQYLAERGMRTIRKSELETRHVGVRIRYEDGRGDEAGKTLDRFTSIDEDLLPVIWELLARIHVRRVGLTHFGVVFSGFRRRSPQGDLFEVPRDDRATRLHAAIDEIRDRYGHSSIMAGKSIGLLGATGQGTNGFIMRTPSLTK